MESLSAFHHNIKALRHNKKLCDFCILIGNTRYEVHKLVLAARSDYFKAMFTQDTLESKRNEVSLHDIPSRIMEDIIDFCYSSEISLNNDNVQELLIASSMLQMEELKRICVEHCKKLVSIHNCIGVMVVADRYNIDSLFKVAFEFCVDNYKQVAEESEFVQIEPALLVKLTANNDLNSSEDEILESVIKWYEVDPESRKPSLEEVLCNIRYGLLDRLRLVQVSQRQEFKNREKLRDLIDEAKNFHLLDGHEAKSKLTLTKESQFIQRVPHSIRGSFICAIGGWSGGSIAGVERYHPHEDCWTKMKPMSTPRFGLGVAVHDNSIYVVGGHDGKTDLKSVERYDLATDTWHHDVPDMWIERTSVCVIATPGHIFAIGGESASSHCFFSEIECFRVQEGRWVHLAPMLEKRLGAGAAALNGLIYMVGGAREGSRDVVNTVERYNPALNKWEFVAPMIQARKHLGCTTYEGKIYAAGGRNKAGEELDSAEYYDPELNAWVPIPSMQVKRTGIGLVELHGLIYAVGGNNGKHEVNIVEAYNPETELWSRKAPLIEERIGGGLTVVSSPPRYYRHSQHQPYD